MTIYLITKPITYANWKGPNGHTTLQPGIACESYLLQELGERLLSMAKYKDILVSLGRI